MNQFLKNLRLPAIIGLVLILPLMIMEYVNRLGFHEEYPTPIFVVLLLVAMGFVYALLSLVRDARAGTNLLERPIALALKIAALIACAWTWIAIVLDQMPCFLGVPLCD